MTTDGTIQVEANAANPNTFSDVLRKMRFGDMLSPIKVIVAGIAEATAFDITSAAVKAAATITGIVLAADEKLPPIKEIIALRTVTPGIGGTPCIPGPMVATDAGGATIAPYDPGAGVVIPGVAKLSDDGKTLTLDGTCVAFTIIFLPRSHTDLAAKFLPVA